MLASIPVIRSPGPPRCERQRGNIPPYSHLRFDRDVSERTRVMITVHSSDEELRFGLCKVERENGLRDLALGNKRLEDRGTPKVRDGLVCHTQDAIRSKILDIEALASTRSRAKHLTSGLITRVVNYPSARPRNMHLTVYPARVTVSVYCSVKAQSLSAYTISTGFPTYCAVELAEGSYSVRPRQVAPQETPGISISLAPVSNCTVHHVFSFDGRTTRNTRSPVNVRPGVPTMIAPYHTSSSSSMVGTLPAVRRW